MFQYPIIAIVVYVDTICRQGALATEVPCCLQKDDNLLPSSPVPLVFFSHSPPLDGLIWSSTLREAANLLPHFHTGHIGGHILNVDLAIVRNEKNSLEVRPVGRGCPQGSAAAVVDAEIAVALQDGEIPCSGGSIGLPRGCSVLLVEDEISIALLPQLPCVGW